MPHLGDLRRRKARAGIGGQIGLRVVAFLGGLGELVGQFTGVLGGLGGDILGVFLRGLRIGQLLFRLGQLGLRGGERLLGAGKIRLRFFLVALLGVTIRDQ